MKYIVITSLLLFCGCGEKKFTADDARADNNLLEVEYETMLHNIQAVYSGGGITEHNWEIVRTSQQRMEELHPKTEMGEFLRSGIITEDRLILMDIRDQLNGTSATRGVAILTIGRMVALTQYDLDRGYYNVESVPQR